MKKNTQPIIASTYTFRYIPIEDRIKMSINYKDKNNRINLMITRKLLLEIFPAVNKHIEEYYTKDFDKVNKILEKIGFNENELKDIGKVNSNNTPTKKTDYSILDSFGDDLYLIEKIGLTYFEDKNKSRITFFSTDKDKIVIGFLDGDGLSKIMETIRLNTPVNWFN